MARSVTEEHVKWTGNAQSLVSESKRAEDAVRKSSSAITKSLNDTAKVLRGGEQVLWLTTIGRGLSNATGQILEMQQALREGTANVADLTQSFLQSLPVIGDFAKAGENLYKIFSGDAAAEAGADLSNRINDALLAAMKTPQQKAQDAVTKEIDAEIANLKKLKDEADTARQAALNEAASATKMYTKVVGGTPVVEQVPDFGKRADAQQEANKRLAEAKHLTEQLAKKEEEREKKLKELSEKAYTEYISKLKEEIDLFGMSAAEAAIYKINQQNLADGLRELTETEKDAIRTKHQLLEKMKEEQKSFEDSMKQYRSTLEKYNGVSRIDQLRKELRQLVEMFTRLGRQSPADIQAFQTAYANLANEIDSLTPGGQLRAFTEELKKQMELLGMTAEQAKIYQLAKEGASEADVAAAQAALDELSAKQSLLEWIEATKTPLEKYNEQLAELQKLKDAGMLSADLEARSMKKITDEYQSASPRQTHDPLATTAMRGSQEALANIFRYRNQDRLQTGQPVELQQLTETKKIVGYMSEIAEKVRKGELIEIY